MANSITHAALPYPIKGCRFTLWVPYLDADGDPTDPTTPDTERSIDGAAFADCTEEVSTISGSNGTGYITLTGDELNASLVAVCAKASSGPKATLAVLLPRVLPVVRAGTAQAGAAGTITLDASASHLDDYYNGCFVRTTGGTGGGGGSGSLDNQARRITDYVGSTKVATVVPNWETNPSSDTTFEVLATPEWVAMLATAPVDVASISGDSAAADNLEAACDGTGYNVGGGAVVAASVTGNVGGNVAGSVASVTGNVGGSVASVTGNVGGNVAGSVGSVTAGVTLADDAITSAKFDESTAFPLTAADTGSTAVARTGADGDTLETLSEQIDAVPTLAEFVTVDTGETTAVDGSVAKIAQGASGLTAQDIWEYSPRTLTQPAQSVAEFASGTLQIWRGDTWETTITGLGDITDATEVVLTIKRNREQADSEAILQVGVTATPVGNALVYEPWVARVNGAAPAEGAVGGITIQSPSTGVIVASAEAEITAQLPAGRYHYDVQAITPTAVQTLSDGTCTIGADVTRATVGSV